MGTRQARGPNAVAAGACLHVARSICRCCSPMFFIRCCVTNFSLHAPSVGRGIWWLNLKHVDTTHGDGDTRVYTCLEVVCVTLRALEAAMTRTIFTQGTNTTARTHAHFSLAASVIKTLRCCCLMLIVGALCKQIARSSSCVQISTLATRGAPHATIARA